MGNTTVKREIFIIPRFSFHGLEIVQKIKKFSFTAVHVTFNMN